jgi:DNA helicase-2/ATP-dependent DNA helicase PcrA
MAKTAKDIRHYNEAFSKALDMLNAAQREAVEQIDGPVLAIAGPGTGKTHILTARIGRILMETDAQPHNILCLTFTDAGVIAMRERLLEFIGPEAHRVHIFTFHSFCNTIIQNHLELFGRHELEPLNDLERVELIRQLIDDQDVEHPLKRGRANSYFYEGHLYGLFKKMKSEDWSVEMISEAIDSYLDDLPNREENRYKVNTRDFKKGDLKKAKIEDIERRMELLRTSASLFPAYQKAMDKARRYDFEDMILWVLRAFDQNESLLRNYQEQYLYFLVDEYQDTNGAQNELLQKLIGFWQNPNMFIVGDDDQSIYEFQGARLKNLVDFHDQYEKDLKLVVLKNNYRSSNSILRLAESLIGFNQKRIVNSLSEKGVDKTLIASHPKVSKTKIKPQVIAWPNRWQEITGVAQKIEALQKTGVKPEEIAVIYAQHRQADNLFALLEKKGITYNSRRKVNILDQPLIRNLRMLLDYLHLEYKKPFSGEYLLYKVLHFAFLGIAPTDLAALSILMVKENKGETNWRLAIGNKNMLKKAGVKNSAPFLRFAAHIDELLLALANESIPVFLEKLINRSGLLKYITLHKEKIWLMQVLNTFFSFVRQEGIRRPRMNLTKLLDLLKSMDDNRLAIGLEKVIQANEGVHLLTAHSAKGLEFEHVFILDCVKDFWEPRSRSAFSFSMPDTLTFSGEEDALEARRRLFFVAMTRAKEGLYISYSQMEKNKPLQRAVFVDEITDKGEVEILEKEVPEDQLVEATLLQMQESSRPNIAAMEKAIVDALLKDFSLSVSAMNRYLKCPVSFYYERILRVPTMMSEAAAYGTAMHNALQRLFDKMLLSKTRTFPDIPHFLRFFENELLRQKAHFSLKEYERRLEVGRRNIENLHRQFASTWHKNVKVEFVIKNVEIEGVPVNGTIDKLELYEGMNAKIIDYKTGSHSSSKRSAMTVRNPLGGNYRRQVIFYKLLYENAPGHNNTITAGVIQYLEPNPKGEFVAEEIKILPKEVVSVKNMITETYQNILDHNFYEGCGESNCSWCAFVKDNTLPESFSDPDIEELDD